MHSVLFPLNHIYHINYSKYVLLACRYWLTKIACLSSHLFGEFNLFTPLPPPATFKELLLSCSLDSIGVLACALVGTCILWRSNVNSTSRSWTGPEHRSFKFSTSNISMLSTHGNTFMYSKDMNDRISPAVTESLLIYFMVNRSARM